MTPFNPSFLQLTSEYPLVPEYQAIIQRTLELELSNFNRVCAMRFDLRFPDNMLYQDPKVISRFIDSFKAHLLVWNSRRSSSHSIGFSYVWCRERYRSPNWHYHLIFLFNKDAVCGFGSNAFKDDSIYNRILDSWASAIPIPAEQALGLVHICKNGVYWLDQRSEFFLAQLDLAMKRFSYLAKEKTKDINDGYRNFGSSQKIFLI
ncbi:inovirus Gp2 family protein [Shewanella xiamenensis]|uniref:inovirus Gp2 family protein n=1 Tax=Shewanella xiamenensis TaxID=332186 RepID=UPI0024A6A9D2|nr:inovirus Gp2 family protein [Shewanella xiamenensis]MDI5875771.1 inovirus Gp2 family protein [Shewanella xiamenensis]